MIYQDLKDGNHTWEKQNLITLSDKKGFYDLYLCKGCGIKGKRRGVGNDKIEIDGRAKGKAKLCPAFEPVESQVGVKVKIKSCDAHGRQFANLTPGSVHELIDVPEGRSKDEFWVQGVGEPVRILENEFIFVE